MNDEIVHVPERVRLGEIELAPEQVVERATRIAGTLANVIRDRGLFSTIQGREYVQVEGWNTLGALIGIVPRERYVNKLDGGYEAYVELIRASDGAVIGGASAICTRDERNWQMRDEYAVRSMAITRATGKAFRLSFSWIMKLAGYEATPSEEIVDGQAREKNSGSGGGSGDVDEARLGQDASTRFWAKANHYIKQEALTRDQAQEIVNLAGGNFVEALDRLTAKVEPPDA